MIKKNVRLIILVLFIVMLSFSVTVCFADKNKDIDFVNAILYYVEFDIELLKHCRNNYKNDDELINKIEEMLFFKLLMVSGIAPSVNELTGTPLNAVVSVINYRNKYNFSYTGDYYSDIIIKHLNSIQKGLIDNREYFEKYMSDPIIEFYSYYDSSKEKETE